MPIISEIVQQRIDNHLRRKTFSTVGAVADSLQRQCFVVGGYVRDIFLDIPRILILLLSAAVLRLRKRLPRNWARAPHLRCSEISEPHR